MQHWEAKDAYEVQTVLRLLFVLGALVLFFVGTAVVGQWVK